MKEKRDIEKGSGTQGNNGPSNSPQQLYVESTTTTRLLHRCMCVTYTQASRVARCGSRAGSNAFALVDECCTHLQKSSSPRKTTTFFSTPINECVRNKESKKIRKRNTSIPCVLLLV